MLNSTSSQSPATATEKKKAQKARKRKEILAFLHFPPLWGDFQCDEILNLLEEYGVKRCYFGHIHSCYTAPASFFYHEIEFRLIAADYLEFIPQIIR